MRGAGVLEREMEGLGGHAADCHVTFIDVLQLEIFIRLSSWCQL